MAIWVDEESQDPFQAAITVLMIECHITPDEFSIEAFAGFSKLTLSKLGCRIKRYVDKGFVTAGKIRYQEILKGPSMEYHVIVAEVPIKRRPPSWTRTVAPVIKEYSI